MNKFILISIIIHGALAYNFLKPQNPKLVLKKGGTVEVSFYKTGSNRSSGEIGQLPPKEILENKQEKVEEKKEEVKELPKAEIGDKKVILHKNKKVKKNISPNKENHKKTSHKNENSSEKIDSNKKIVEKVGLEGDDRFTKESDGAYVASNSEGIEYEFINMVSPDYPIMAKKLHYSGKAYVETKFLVDLDGHVKDIEIVGGIDKLGFKEECIKALKQWQFKPIVYKGIPIKVYFYKNFKFYIE